MDEAETPPLIFANRVIRQCVDNLLGGDTILLPRDYAIIRLVFRWCKGSWESLEHGDIIHNRLLTRILVAWGTTAKHKKDVERV